MEVTLPDGTLVLARGRLDLVPADRPRNPDFALYLDQRWEDDSQVTWLHRLIDWPDMGLPLDEPDLFEATTDLYKQARAGALVEVACYGGVGRTGTVLGCLTILAGGSPGEAVAWVREHYHPLAIETPEQQQLIARFAESLSGR